MRLRTAHGTETYRPLGYEDYEFSIGFEWQPPTDDHDHHYSWTICSWMALQNGAIKKFGGDNITLPYLQDDGHKSIAVLAHKQNQHIQADNFEKHICDENGWKKHIAKQRVQAMEEADGITKKALNVMSKGLNKMLNVDAIDRIIKDEVKSLSKS